MAADPILLVAAKWLGLAAGGLLLLTVMGFFARWGIRFRLVGVTSFTTLLAISCAAFAISYSPRISVPGAVTVPLVFDNGSDLVIAAAPAQMAPEAYGSSVQQVALNLRGSGRGTQRVEVRLRRVEPKGDGSDVPVVLATAIRNLDDGTVILKG
jgi:hypothetical protein